MRKSILLILMGVLTATHSVCQNPDVVIQHDFTSVPVEKTSILGKYYLHEMLVDSTLINCDTILLYRDRFNAENATLEFYNDSTFRLQYHIKLIPQTKIDFDTGERLMVMVQTEDEINGTFKISQEDHSTDEAKGIYIKIVLKDGDSCDYLINKNADQVVLIKRDLVK